MMRRSCPEWGDSRRLMEYWSIEVWKYGRLEGWSKGCEVRWLPIGLDHFIKVTGTLASIEQAETEFQTYVIFPFQ